MSSRTPPTLDSSPAMHRILNVLRAGDKTQEQISAAAYVAFTTLQRGGYIRALLAINAIHVCSWNPPRVSGNWTPVYRHGAGESVPRPPAAGQNEYARRYYKKHLGAVRKVVRQMVRLTPERFTMAGHN